MENKNEDGQFHVGDRYEYAGLAVPTVYVTITKRDDFRVWYKESWISEDTGKMINVDTEYQKNVYKDYWYKEGKKIGYKEKIPCALCRDGNFYIYARGLAGV